MTSLNHVAKLYVGRGLDFKVVELQSCQVIVRKANILWRKARKCTYKLFYAIFFKCVINMLPVIIISKKADHSTHTRAHARTRARMHARTHTHTHIYWQIVLKEAEVEPYKIRTMLYHALC